MKDRFEEKSRCRKHASYEIAALKSLDDDAILIVARSIDGFSFLEQNYSFRIDRSQAETLQLSFGKRKMETLGGSWHDAKVECGPTLLYSLGRGGFFLTVVYPMNSEYSQPLEDHLFLQIGETSSLNLISRMEGDLRLLVAYAHVTSIDMTSTLKENISVRLLRLFSSRGEKGEFKRPPFWTFILKCFKFIALLIVKGMTR